MISTASGNAPQRAASDPKLSAWVSANAGSGKTHVLVDRVIRLMLAGTEPSRILCLTFTKAAAAEMSGRLFERLSVWIARSDVELLSELLEIGVEINSTRLLQSARRLFTGALETPGGLKIQTIHAFCERLLQLFPMEAGVVPGFTVMDEREAYEILRDSRNKVLRRARRERCGELDRALNEVVVRLQANAFDKLVAEVLNKRAELRSVLSDENGLDNAMAQLRHAMGLGPSDDKQSIRSTLLLERADYHRLISALGSGSNSDVERSQLVSEVLNRQGSLLDLKKMLLTNEDQSRNISAIVSKKVRDKNPWLLTFVSTEQERLKTAIGKFSDLEHLYATRSLLFLTSKIVAEYEAAKRMGGLYDFSDLILRTSALLRSRPDAAWVLYKLDGGLDHILVDEAQDTNPSQWQIVQSLISEFFSGQGSHLTPDRTLFVVGDRKQSIFSFQGADPDVFETVHDVFGSLIEAAGQKFRDVDFTVSFRSTVEVLKAVDAVFHESRIARRGLDGPKPRVLVHESSRRDWQGLVELWPLIEPENTERQDPWTAPVDHLPGRSPRRKLALQIAQKIKSWIGQREIAALGRTVRPSDILILVRRRNSFFDALIRELRKAGIPVAGADRLDLLKSIAVLDVLALARFCLLPEDDHSLACVLKSPLVQQPLSEDELFEIAWNRGTKTLWERLAINNNPACTAAHRRIVSWLEEARTARPYEFFSKVLLTTRRSIHCRLGSEASDALDALLEQALDYDRSQSSSLSGFIQWFAAGGVEIKRNMEQASSEVRIMTVHGAKGLEAPIVILPDTTDVPDRRRQSLFMMVDGGGTIKLPFWRLPKTLASAKVSTWLSESDLAQVHEYRRLLYVAMTRARDELYIAGYCGTHALQPHCWYGLIAEALIPEMMEIGKNEGWRLGPQQCTVATIQMDNHSPPDPLPDWATAMATPDDKTAKTLTVSRPGKRVVSSNKLKLNRGLLLHRLLQHLPDIDSQRREDFARDAIKRAGFDGTLLEEIRRMYLDPETNKYLGPGGLAEVPLMHRLRGQGRPILGRIDRLIITDNEVLILDYKSDNPWPESADDVRRDYLIQLGAYREALAQIYPEKPVRAALLWTAAPLFMPVSTENLDNAMAEHFSACT